MRDGEHDAQIRVHGAVRAERDGNSGRKERVQRLRRRGERRPEAPAQEIGDGEVHRVLNDDRPEFPREWDEVGGQEVGVLDARAQRAPGRVRRRPAQRHEHQAHRAVAHGVDQQLVSRGERLRHDRAHRVGREVQLAAPAGAVGVGPPHQGPALDRGAVEDVLRARDVERGAGPAAALAGVGEVARPGARHGKPDQAPADRQVGRADEGDGARRAEGVVHVLERGDPEARRRGGVRPEIGATCGVGARARQPAARRPPGVLGEAAVEVARASGASQTAAERIGRVVPEAEGGERGAVQNRFVARPALQHRGVVREDAVEEKAVGAWVVEHAVADAREQPRAARVAAAHGGERVDQLAQPGLGRRPHGDAARDGGDVRVRVVDAGDHGPAAQVADAGARARQRAHRVARPGGDDPLPPDREGLHPGAGGVGGEDPAADEDQVGRAASPAGADRERQGDGDGRPAHLRRVGA